MFAILYDVQHELQRRSLLNKSTRMKKAKRETPNQRTCASVNVFFPGSISIWVFFLSSSPEAVDLWITNTNTTNITTSARVRSSNHTEAMEMLPATTFRAQPTWN